MRNSAELELGLTGGSLWQLHLPHDQPAPPEGFGIDPRLGAVTLGPQQPLEERTPVLKPSSNSWWYRWNLIVFHLDESPKWMIPYKTTYLKSKPSEIGHMMFLKPIFETKNVLNLLKNYFCIRIDLGGEQLVTWKLELITKSKRLCTFTGEMTLTIPKLLIPREEEKPPSPAPSSKPGKKKSLEGYF